MTLWYRALRGRACDSFTETISICGASCTISTCVLVATPAWRRGGRSQSDLTLGDYWGVERTCPDLDQALDENKGTSVVLIHSERGRSLLEGLPCRYQETNYASAVAGNPAIEQSVAEPPKRQLFFEQINAEPLEQLIARLTATPLHKRLWRRLHHQAHRVKLRLRRLARG